MKKVYLAAASLMALSQSASALNCYFSCTASKCGSSQSTFNQCWSECKGTVNSDGSLTGNNIKNCIRAAQNAGFTDQLARQLVAKARTEVAALTGNAGSAPASRGYDAPAPAPRGYDAPAASPRGYEEYVQPRQSAQRQAPACTCCDADGYAGC